MSWLGLKNPYLVNKNNNNRGATSRHFRPLQTSAPQSATLPVRPRDHCQEVIKKTYIASTDDATIRPQDHWQEKPRKSCSNL